MEQVLSVTQLNEYVSRIMAHDPLLRCVCVKGELSNVKKTASGHVYFSLKDAGAIVSCVMFAEAAAGLTRLPPDGARARVYGYVSLYVREGRYQLYADALEEDGEGELFAVFAQLKARLEAEGYFDPSHKKPLPYIPRTIGVVTSRTGAVVHDILNVLRRRFKALPVLLCPVKVQGDGAAAEIAMAVSILDSVPEVDVIIVGRGGGSIEELWAFNEPEVVEAIYAAKTPVVSAVGHETDFTLCDFVSDVRAPTPSAAAELCAPDCTELLNALDRCVFKAEREINASIALCRSKLQTVRARLMASHPQKQAHTDKLKLEALKKRLSLAAPNTKSEKESLALCEKALKNAANAFIKSKSVQPQGLFARLTALDPYAVIDRGYAIVKSGESCITSVDGLKSGMNVTLVVRGGSAEAGIQSVLKN